ncbi:MAG: hypothetical protein JO103_02180 [Candidatus Eremiobacteraeota bacterium]|nr:hypothetical protein [Candidatus Eremiobacteraeota bacterium]MBV9407628.1 hypothetical protein [Candidatus Eremiobacteraeota bacterium]
MINDPTPAYAYAPPTEFSLGRVLSRTNDTFSRGALAFVAISLIATLPSLAYQWATLSGFGGPRSVAIVQGLLNIVLQSLAEAMIIYGAFQTMRGRTAQVGASIARGFRRGGAILLASLLVGIATGIAWILLVVPGLIVMTMLCVTIPAVVVEQLGATTAMGRSAELTKGYRWHIFGALFVVGLVTFVVEAIVVAVLAHPGTAWIFTLVTFCVTSVSAAYNSVLAAIMYHDLRVIKDGIDIDQLAAVFD